MDFESKPYLFLEKIATDIILKNLIQEISDHHDQLSFDDFTTPLPPLNDSDEVGAKDDKIQKYVFDFYRALRSRISSNKDEKVFGGLDSPS